MVRRVPAPRPIHLRPSTELADRVLLPGDPHRALAIAQDLLASPRMFNHHRGLWGYTGDAADGRPLTVQATGMGGPSAAIVVEELILLGARTLIRVGTCGAIAPGLELGDVVAATAAIPADGASVALGATNPVLPDRALTDALLEGRLDERQRPRAATIASTDLFYDDRAEVAPGWLADGAVAVEMEAATVLYLAARRGVAAACLLGVSDVLGAGAKSNERLRIDADGLEALGLRLGAVAYAALAGLPNAEAASG